ncbi:sensor domain-containing phosphodiesterase [Chitinibacteraceae bacterium HSL-7]
MSDVFPAGEAGDSRFEQVRELGFYHVYVDAIDSVVSRLLTDDEGLADVLATLADITRASAIALYLDCQPGVDAQLAAVWRDERSSCAEAAFDGELEYRALPTLADAVALGMMVNRSLLALAPVEQTWLARLGARRLIVLPLLNGATSFGCLILVDEAAEQPRSAIEFKLLGMLANQIALALVRRRVETGMREGEQRLRALVGATDDMVLELGGDGVVQQAWSGHPAMPSPAVLTGTALAQHLPAEAARALADAIVQVLAERRSASIQCQLGRYWLRIRLQPLPQSEWRLVALVSDITELMVDAARKKTMLDTLNLLEEAIVDLGRQGELIECTPAWATLRGIEPRALSLELGRLLLDWVHPDDRAALEAALPRIGGRREVVAQRFRLIREDGEALWVEARLIATRGADGQVSGCRGVLRDVTAAHLNEQHVRELAHYDSLTKLPNRVLLDHQLEAALGRARHDNCKVALGFIDLDHFKQINDAFGHKTGDALLVNVAQRLRAVLRDEDVLARWGGDEFVVVLPDLADASRLPEIAERLRQAARQGVMVEGLEAKPTISVGFAVFPDNAGSADELLTAADHTMYYAKNAGRNTACFYSDILHMKALGREHVAIQSRLTDAIRFGKLQVYFQPIVNSRSGDVYAVEALARWQDDKNGWISPELFIPMAEKVGLIQELSEVVMHESFHRLRQWRDAGLTQKLMINISRSQLFAPRFVANLIDKLGALKLRPSDVIIEITESIALTDLSRQMRHLKLLTAAGFQLAIDDFGTGYSSLSQLHDMPAQLLKVDVSFAQRLDTDDGRRVMQAIVQLGHGLGLAVIVEGVESLECARFLQGLGVEFLQGFHFSEAVPSGVAELWMRLGLAGKA